MIYIKQFLTWLMDEEDTFIFEETTVPPIYSKGDTTEQGVSGNQSAMNLSVYIFNFNCSTLFLEPFYSCIR